MTPFVTIRNVSHEWLFIVAGIPFLSTVWQLGRFPESIMKWIDCAPVSWTSFGLRKLSLLRLQKSLFKIIMQDVVFCQDIVSNYCLAIISPTITDDTLMDVMVIQDFIRVEVVVVFLVQIDHGRLCLLWNSYLVYHGFVTYPLPSYFLQILPRSHGDLR